MYLSRIHHVANQKLTFLVKRSNVFLRTSLVKNGFSPKAVPPRRLLLHEQTSGDSNLQSVCALVWITTHLTLTILLIITT